MAMPALDEAIACWEGQGIGGGRRAIRGVAGE